METIDRSLKLIDSARGYRVIKCEDGAYEVGDVDASLAACYSDYDSGHDYAEIDMDALGRLAEFVRLLGGDA